MFGILDVSTSALVAQRTRMEVASANMANIDSAYDPNGATPPFQRRIAMLATGDPVSGSTQGVHVSDIQLDQSPMRAVYDRGHPLANADGYVFYPNIEPTMEMVNAMEASRAYEANITMAEATKQMMQASLRLLA